MSQLQRDGGSFFPVPAEICRNWNGSHRPCLRPVSVLGLHDNTETLLRVLQLRQHLPVMESLRGVLAGVRI